MEFQTCSFCGKRGGRQELFIRGKTGAICFDCSRQVAIVSKREEMTHRQTNHEASFDGNWKEISPRKIKSYLDEFVIGQEEAKRVLSVAVYNHYKRFFLEQNKDIKTDDGIEIEKSNMVFIGETGVGKTHLLKTISRKLKVPFCVVDAKSMTQAGYVGDDPEIMLSRLLHAAGFNIEATEWGIVFIDEIDKIAAYRETAITNHDIGKGVQQAILKMVEGSIINVPTEVGRRHPEQRTVSINTKNILFICGGAFEGIQHIIKKRLSLTTIGFEKKLQPHHQVKEEKIIKYVTPQDLKDYGLIPELVGRFPVIVHLNPLTKDIIKKILLEPKNAILKQYKKLFAMEEIDLNFTPEALDAIVANVIKEKLGARSLRSTLEKILKDAMFELPDQEKKKNTYVIDEAYVNNKLATSPQEIKHSIEQETYKNSLQQNFIS